MRVWLAKNCPPLVIHGEREKEREPRHQQFSPRDKSCGFYESAATNSGNEHGQAWEGGEGRGGRKQMKQLPLPIEG